MGPHSFPFQGGKTLHPWPCLGASWDLPNISPDYELKRGIWLLLFLIHIKRKKVSVKVEQNKPLFRFSQILVGVHRCNSVPKVLVGFL